MHGSFVGIILPIFAQLAIFSQLKLTMKCGETKTTSPSKMWNTMIFGGILILFFSSQCFFSSSSLVCLLMPFDVIICAALCTSHCILHGKRRRRWRQQRKWHGNSLRGEWIHATYTKIVTKHWMREGDLCGFWLDASNFLVFVQLVAFSIAKPNEYFVFDIRKVYENMNSGCKFRFFFYFSSFSVDISMLQNHILAPGKKKIIWEIKTNITTK